MTLPGFPPLLERASKTPIADALSLDRRVLRNDATLLSVAPLSIKMPDRQWSYGVLFPLDQDMLPTKEPCVAHIKLVADGGAVGVAGCSADGARLTTPETVARGATEIRLTLDSPGETGAIVVRNVTGLQNGSVTIQEIGLSQLGAERLAPRHHDLGYDLFVILSATKTGTQTIESTLKALSPSVRVYRVHFASPAGILKVRRDASELEAAIGADNEVSKSFLYQADVGDMARADVATVRRYGGRVAFFTAVREPVGRAVAQMFQSLPWKIPVYPDLYRFNGVVFAQMLADGLVAAWERELAQSSSASAPDMWTKCLDFFDFMNDEFQPVSGFDPLAHTFDVHKGYARIDQGDDTALVFRTSELGRSLPIALADITSQSIERFTNSNVGAEKKYAELYKDVVCRLRVPPQLAEGIYRRHAYMTHFFDKDEIDNLIRRWSAPHAAVGTESV